MFCQKCGKEINDEAVICVHCGCAVSGKKVVEKTDSSTSNKAILAVLSFLIPLVGIIYGAINYKKDPNAKSYIFISLGSIVLYLFMLMVMGQL